MERPLGEGAVGIRGAWQHCRSTVNPLSFAFALAIIITAGLFLRIMLKCGLPLHRTLCTACWATGRPSTSQPVRRWCPAAPGSYRSFPSIRQSTTSKRVSVCVSSCPLPCVTRQSPCQWLLSIPFPSRRAAYVFAKFASSQLPARLALPIAGWWHSTVNLDQSVFVSSFVLYAPSPAAATGRFAGSLTTPPRSENDLLRERKQQAHTAGNRSAAAVVSNDAAVGDGETGGPRTQLLMGRERRAATMEDDGDDYLDDGQDELRRRRRRRR